MENVNWLSLIIAAIVPMVIGFIWYHPAIFGKAWMEATGMTEEKMKSGNMGMIYGTSIAAAFLIAFFLLGFNNGPGQEGEFDTFGHGFTHGLIITIFLVLPVLLTKKLHEHGSWKNLWITVGYWAVTIGMMGGVIDVMNHWPN